MPLSARRFVTLAVLAVAVPLLVYVGFTLVQRPTLAQPGALRKAPELEGGVAWLNTDKPIKLADLKGKLVLLDFWTFCCINCIHTLPDLAKLEKKYEKELVVIGVH